jgi:hypothetical protein
MQGHKDVDNIFQQLQTCQVSGEWMLEYCGVAFGDQMEDDLPIPAAEANDLLGCCILPFLTSV